MSDFKIGEILIGQNHVCQLEYNGMECEIVGALIPRKLVYEENGPTTIEPAYEVLWANGSRLFSTPNHLRRRKPPQADTNERMYVQMWRDMAGKAPQRVGEAA